tara:strand:+ start:29881 stop:30405 length:525 start_codon:yes stop_codon:yes gene_type:complete
MTLLKNYFFILSLTSMLFLNCSKSDDNSNTAAKGTITLSGEETSIFGTSLVVANILEGAYQTGTEASVTLLHKNINIDTDGEIAPTPTSLTESFIIVTAQFDSDDSADVEKAISMIIIKNSEEYRFTCTSTASNDDCGDGFQVNQADRQVIFNNTTVVNTESEKILTMNGTITW